MSTGRREAQAEAEDDVLRQRLYVDRVLADRHQHVGTHHHRLLVRYTKYIHANTVLHYCITKQPCLGSGTASTNGCSMLDSES